YFRDFGAWSPDEIAAWSDTDLNALLLQDIAGNVREAGLDDLSEDSSPDEIREAFAKYDADQDVSHLLFLDDDQRIYYYVGCYSREGECSRYSVTLKSASVFRARD